MARRGRPSSSELRRNFERELTSAISGGGLRSNSGLDVPTRGALIEVAKAYPVVSEDLIAAARAAFAGQLDGSNAQARRAVIDQLLAETHSDPGSDSQR
ncbi:hypothetical protein [Nocardia sp. NPDC051832]|uniref:hypothetical protein n=1 Tax=Nocardia sp. NPDC051832 TaxID=3155673 RepID=UPI0034200E81